MNPKIHKNVNKSKIDNNLNMQLTYIKKKLLKIFSSIKKVFLLLFNIFFSIVILIINKNTISEKYLLNNYKENSLEKFKNYNKLIKELILLLKNYQEKFDFQPINNSISNFTTILENLLNLQNFEISNNGLFRMYIINLIILFIFILFLIIYLIRRSYLKGFKNIIDKGLMFILISTYLIFYDDLQYLINKNNFNLYEKIFFYLFFVYGFIIAVILNNFEFGIFKMGLCYLIKYCLLNLQMASNEEIYSSFYLPDSLFILFSFYLINFFRTKNKKIKVCNLKETENIQESFENTLLSINDGLLIINKKGEIYSNKRYDKNIKFHFNLINGKEKGCSKKPFNNKTDSRLNFYFDFFYKFQTFLFIENFAIDVPESIKKLILNFQPLSYNLENMRILFQKRFSNNHLINFEKNKIEYKSNDNSDVNNYLLNNEILKSKMNEGKNLNKKNNTQNDNHESSNLIEYVNDNIIKLYEKQHIEKFFNQFTIDKISQEFTERLFFTIKKENLDNKFENLFLLGEFICLNYEEMEDADLNSLIENDQNSDFEISNIKKTILNKVANKNLSLLKKQKIFMRYNHINDTIEFHYKLVEINEDSNLFKKNLLIENVFSNLLMKICHEIRNPLINIKEISKFLKFDIKELKNYFNKNSKSTLVKDFLKETDKILEKISYQNYRIKHISNLLNLTINDFEFLGTIIRNRDNQEEILKKLRYKNSMNKTENCLNKTIKKMVRSFKNKINLNNKKLNIKLEIKKFESKFSKNSNKSLNESNEEILLKNAKNQYKYPLKEDIEINDISLEKNNYILNLNSNEIYLSNNMSSNLQNSKETLIYSNSKTANKENENLFVDIDFDLIDHIVYNLISNAIKFSNCGEILVKLNYEIISKKLFIHISDNGIGIKENDLNNLGDLLYKVESNKNNIYGLGLGLYCTRLIVSSFNGEFNISSKYGKGTNIDITLDLNYESYINEFFESKSPLLNNAKYEQENESINLNNITKNINILKYNYKNSKNTAKNFEFLNENLKEKIIGFKNNSFLIHYFESLKLMKDKEQQIINERKILTKISSNSIISKDLTIKKDLDAIDDINDMNQGNLRARRISSKNNIFKLNGNNYINYNKYKINNFHLSDGQNNEYHKFLNKRINSEKLELSLGKLTILPEIRIKNSKSNITKVSSFKNFSKNKNLMHFGKEKDLNLKNKQLFNKLTGDFDIRTSKTGITKIKIPKNYQINNHKNIQLKEKSEIISINKDNNSKNNSNLLSFKKNTNNSFQTYRIAGSNKSKNIDSNKEGVGELRNTSVDSKAKEELKKTKSIENSKILDDLEFKINYQDINLNFIEEDSASFISNVYNSNFQKNIKTFGNLKENIEGQINFGNNLDSSLMKKKTFSSCNNSVDRKNSFKNLCGNDEEAPLILRFLIVDDEYIIRKSQSNIIKKYFLKKNINIEIEECEDGIDCLYKIYTGILKGITFDMIFTDETMNFMKGSMLAEIIQKLMDERIIYDIKISMISSYDENIIEEKGYFDLIDFYATKPLSLKILDKIFYKFFEF